MRSIAADEASSVEKPARTRTPKATATKPSTPRKRATPAKSPAPHAKAAPLTPPNPPVEEQRRRRVLPVVASGLIILVSLAAAASLMLVGRWDWSSNDSPGAATEVSTEELAAFAGSHGAPVYWAGELPDHALELTSTTAGTFVRYLPAGIAVGAEGRALTVATYPLTDAYRTAATRAKEAGMISRTIRNDGLAVWSKAQPTSVYVAFRGVPSLVEVYAPVATEARSVALSGQVRAVR